jgi:hypothetical protein
VGDLVRPGELPRFVERASAQPPARRIDVQLDVLRERLVERRARDDHEDDGQQDRGGGEGECKAWLIECVDRGGAAYGARSSKT